MKLWVQRSMACTFENEVVSAKEYGSICFGSLNKVMNDDELVCLGDGKAQVKDCSSKTATHSRNSSHWRGAQPVEQGLLGRARCSSSSEGSAGSLGWSSRAARVEWASTCVHRTFSVLCGKICLREIISCSERLIQVRKLCFTPLEFLHLCIRLF